MYFQLTEAMKRRFILELRRFWAGHPKYRDDLVTNIQGKYSFKERPQYGIIVKTGNASKVQLSNDNYIGSVQSYCFMARVPGFSGKFLEWVREDSLAIRGNNAVFPTPAGVYYLEITSPTEFVIDSVYSVFYEDVAVAGTTATLQNPYIQGTLRLFEMPSRFEFLEGSHYTGDPETGILTLSEPLAKGASLYADYKYQGDTTGPWNWQENTGLTQPLPGVVLAFGRQGEVGDRVAIVVQDRRELAALEYGGKWELSLDFDVIARDVYSQQEIADRSLMFVWGILRTQLINEGLEITEASLGGESEEAYDENADDYFYNSTFSVTLTTDWSIHVPLVQFVSNVQPYSVDAARSIPNTLAILEKNPPSSFLIAQSLGLQLYSDPFFVNRNGTFELIH